MFTCVANENKGNLRILRYFSYGTRSHSTGNVLDLGVLQQKLAGNTSKLEKTEKRSVLLPSDVRPIIDVHGP